MENKTVKFICVRPGVLVEEGLDVTPITVKHYARLVGRRVKEIQFVDYGANEPLAVLVFHGFLVPPRQPSPDITAAVLCDPEGNGPGHLDIQ